MEWRQQNHQPRNGLAPMNTMPKDENAGMPSSNGVPIGKARDGPQQPLFETYDSDEFTELVACRQQRDNLQFRVTLATLLANITIQERMHISLLPSTPCQFPCQI
jgi:hypothetical protein